MKNKENTSNRLIHEKSPYLLQHADNPVDWYPWGEEAFAKAKKEDKPIFLSIGYSTCHWCHVMEHESFEDVKVAEKINEYFVPIKVDREERPDIDSIYMSAVMALTGHGGWPMTVILTPDKKPFFGGTYYPPYPKWGSPGLMEIMEFIHKAWQNNRQELIESSTSLTDVLKEKSSQGEKVPLTENTFKRAFNYFFQNYDQHFGGFGHAPKFPSSHNLSFLLRYWKRSGDPQALKMVEHTLQEMAKGGMYDQLGGGFHRYSTDEKWHVPHFEKMLYDQAILVRTYLEAYQITRNEFYARTAREIFDYVLRDMRDKVGGFYSAEDADSLDPAQEGDQKKEGAFYVWDHKEIENVLDQKDTEIFIYYFGVSDKGNVASDPHGEFIEKNILYQAHTLEEVKDHFKKSMAEIKDSLKKSRQKLIEVRTKRPRPHLDDKILVDWNGLMISGLAVGSRILKEPKYREAAQQAADFILERLLTPQRRLLHRYRDKDAAIVGTLEDYAFFIHALLDLYETSFEVKYLERAVDLAAQMLEFFWDAEKGGFFMTAEDGEKILFRPKELYDGAIPSGNSMAALDLIRLWHLTLDSKWEIAYKDLLDSFSADVAERPMVYGQFLIALDFALGPSQEIIIAGDENDSKMQKMVEEIFKRFLPRRTLMVYSAKSPETKKLFSLAPFIKEQARGTDKPTVYICENHVCQLPIEELNQLEEALNHLK